VRSLAGEFLASLYMPRRAAVLGVVIMAAIAAAFAALKQSASDPIDVTWPYYLNFAMVYAFQVGPVLVYAFFSLKAARQFPWHPPAVRFLCLIPAYNEERVIQNSVGSLLAQDYPQDLYEVCVVSDGSEDRTEEISRGFGARVLRTTSQGFGKHRALGYAFERLLSAEDGDLYVCVFDADNRVGRNYLQEMNNAICAGGYRCLQGFHDVLNGPANWITKSLWVSCVASSRLYNPGRDRGLGTALICGTGWCCQARLLQQYWPLIGTQTEDIELTGLLLLHEGIGVPWVPDAHIYDEKPLNLWVAIRQRHRWMTGHMRVAALLAWPCLREGIRRRDFRLCEMAAYYVLPLAMNLGSVQVLLILGLHLGIFTIHGPLAAPTLKWLLNEFTLLYLFGYQVGGFGRETGLWVRGGVYSLYGAVFSFLAWTPALAWACFSVFREDWIFHTPHVTMVETVKTAAAPEGGGE
jgi:cellulose synthase/poly-beta-1,6-N-acetylglucosamine synthase-like glycosyltransferase